MSVRIQYSCPNCKNVLSGYSKKGFPALHTGIGLPVLLCTRCACEISTGMQPWSSMRTNKKLIEVSKTFLNIFIICSIFGGLFLGMGLFYLSKELNILISIFDLSTVSGRLLQVFFYMALGTISVGYYKYRGYKKYSDWVEKLKNENRLIIPFNEFEEKYPDW